ncbi:MAG: LPS translocon maturation chaperone LptM [Hyphomicrobiaceae bacterium]
MQDAIKRNIWLLATISTLGAAAMLGGCGVRGSLDAPPAAQASGEATSPEAADAGKDSAAPPKKHRPFILDSLL